jgi:lysophospholipase L1-like esterase
VAINKYGLRDREIRIPKPPQTVRVLVVGDSVTFGYGIPIEDTYAKVLERLLNATASPSKRYEVLNGGVLGGSLSDYYYFLSQKASLLQPDLVIVGISLNNIHVYSSSGEISEDGAEWQGHDMPTIRLVNEFVLRHSQLYLFTYSRLKSFLYSIGALDINTLRGENFSTLLPPSDYQTAEWNSSYAMLSQIVRFCRGNGYGIMVVVFPMQMQMSSAEFKFFKDKFHLRLGDGTLSGEPQRRLKEFGAKSGVDVIDLLPVFRRYPAKEMYLHNSMVPADPCHPSVKGNEVAAAEILYVLKASFL